MSEETEGRLNQLRKPDWLRIKLPSSGDYAYLKGHLKKNQLHTICESGNCPNLGECWAARTATFMILGDICTRNCRFCGVKKGNPEPADTTEYLRIANAVKELGIKHCVLTSVTRDDLSDGGASIWASTVMAIREKCPGTTVETLIPDFKGDDTSLQLIIQSKPEVISHNLETVRRLTPSIRIHAEYNRSLSLLKFLSSHGARTKSGIMVGLGETDNEVYQTMDDLFEVGCSIITIGQYLQPTRNHHPVDRFVNPGKFDEYAQIAIEKGFSHAECRPLVRSSYHAEKHLL